MNRTSLERSLLSEVLVITFNRKTPPVGAFRRMLCTKCDEVLNTALGKIKLGFWRPRQGPRFDEAKHNVVIVWDIFKRDYRVVPCETVKIEDRISPDDFWKYYKENAGAMTWRQKEAFMYAK